METFAIQFGIHCIASGSPCRPFYVAHDCAGVSCPDCGKEIDLSLFRIANRTIIIGIDLLNDESLNHISFGFSSIPGDDDRGPSELAAGRDYDSQQADFSIGEVNYKRDFVWMRFAANPDYAADVRLFADVFTHADHPLAGEEYLPQGYLAPVLAGVQLWNTGYMLARQRGFQVWPLFAGEIWHGQPDEA